MLIERLVLADRTDAGIAQVCHEACQSSKKIHQEKEESALLNILIQDHDSFILSSLTLPAEGASKIFRPLYSVANVYESLLFDGMLMIKDSQGFSR